MSERASSSVALVLALAWHAPALGQTSVFYVPDSTFASEDQFPIGDADQNDVVLRYNKRCIVEDASTTLIAEDVRFTPTAAGASLTNALVLQFDTAPSEVRMSDDGGASFTLMCASEVDCGTSVTLYADFAQAFTTDPGGFVNTTGDSLVPGKQHVIRIAYAPGVPAPTDGIGALFCPVPGFAIDRPDLATPIDRDTVLPGNKQPMIGDFVDFCPPPLTTCSDAALVPWAVPMETRSITEVYGARFLAWIEDRTDEPPCTPGQCADEDWYKHPIADYIDGALLAATPGLQPAPTCDDLVANGDETAADCGGIVCGPCGPGLACVTDGDCASGTCDPGSGTCAEDADALCDAGEPLGGPDCDGACDPGETGPDCEGTCDAADALGSADCDGICDPGESGPDCPCAPTASWDTLLAAARSEISENLPVSPALGIGPDGTAWVAGQVTAGAGTSWNAWSVAPGASVATLDDAFVTTGPLTPSGTAWRVRRLATGELRTFGTFSSPHASSSWFLTATGDSAGQTWITTEMLGPQNVHDVGPDGRRWTTSANCSAVVRSEHDGSGPVTLPTGLPTTGCTVARLEVDPAGRVWLLADFHSPDERLKVLTSADAGASWSTTLDVANPRSTFFYPRLFVGASSTWLLAVDFAWNGSVQSDGRLYAWQSVGGANFTARLSAYAFPGQFSPVRGAMYDAFPFTIASVDYLFLTPSNSGHQEQRRAVLRLSDSAVVYDVAASSGPAPYQEPEPVQDGTGRVLFLGKDPADAGKLKVWQTTNGTSFSVAATISGAAPTWSHALGTSDGLIASFVQGNTVRIVGYGAGGLADLASFTLEKPWDGDMRPSALAFDGGQPVVIGQRTDDQALLRGRSGAGSWGLVGAPFSVGGGNATFPDLLAGGGGAWLAAMQSDQGWSDYAVWKSSDDGTSWGQDGFGWQFERITAVGEMPGGSLLVAGMASSGMDCSWRILEVGDPFAGSSAALTVVDDFVYDPATGPWDMRCMGAGMGLPAFAPTDIAVGPDDVVWVAGVAQDADGTWHHLLRRGVPQPGGWAWSTVRDDALPSWNVGPVAVAVNRFGQVYLSGQDWQVEMSSDDGATWSHVGDGAATLGDAGGNVRSGLARLAIGPDDAVYAAGHTQTGGTQVLLRRLDCVR